MFVCYFVSYHLQLKIHKLILKWHCNRWKSTNQAPKRQKAGNWLLKLSEGTPATDPYCFKHQKNWLVDFIFYWKFLYPLNFSKSVREGDVFISAMAKSGNTWMQQILHQIRSGGDEDFDDLYDVVPWSHAVRKIFFKN